MLTMRTAVIALFVVSATLGALHASDMQDFFQRVHERGTLTIYQCYRNGTTLEPSSSLNFTVVWIGENTTSDVLDCLNLYRLPGDPENYTFISNAFYMPDGDFALVIGKDGQAQIFLPQPPFRGEAYHFFEVATSSGKAASKIYDTDETCTHAKAFRDQLWEESCGFEYVR